MSRFLKTRHYRLVLPGIKLYVDASDDDEFYVLYDFIQQYMNETGVSYTQEDAKYIEKLYREKYRG